MYCQICGLELGVKHIQMEGEIPFCEPCNKLFFPRVDIAVIVVLTNQNHEVCLTTQNKEGNYKVLIAGFVKQGERLEDCVAREIKEEVGIDITKCTYINSYYYDKNNVLMVGFHAETEQTEFVKDDIEIFQVDWYNKHEVIGRIRDGSIADKLYKQFYEHYKEISF